MTGRTGPLGTIRAQLGTGYRPTDWLSVIDTTGGTPELVILVFVALFVATGLSIYLAIRLYQGYRAGGTVGMLLLGIGLVLLTTVPMVLRLLLSNVPVVEPTMREILVMTTQLLGLLVILGVIYGRR